MFTIAVSGTVHCRAQDAYAELRAYRQYPEWWPIPVEPIAGDCPGIDITPLLFVQIRLVPAESPSETELQYRYMRGPFEGTGKWTIRELSQMPGLTEIQYTVRLEPTSRLAALISSTSLFRWKHTRDIKAIIDRLGQRCTVA